jgi:hypothetical protein
MVSKVPKHPPEFCFNLPTHHGALGAIRVSWGLLGPLEATGVLQEPPGAFWNRFRPFWSLLGPPRGPPGALGPCLAFLGTPVGKPNLAAQRGGHNGDRKSVEKNLSASLKIN